MKNKKILFLVNVDWFFLSHRLPIALAAKEAGYEVFVATADTGNREEIKGYGFTFIEVPFSRKGTNLFREAMMLPRIFSLYRRIKPDLVHHVTIKPVLFGSLVARFYKNIKVVNAITGLGFAFSKDEKASSIKRLVSRAYKVGLQNPRQRTIFQNEEDKAVFVDNGFIKSEQTSLIRGSGVNIKDFKPVGKAEEPPVILLASRMIWDKGLQEFKAAAEIVKKERSDVRFVLAGKSDDGNPNAVPESTLNEWNRAGVVEWWGHCENMPEILQKSAVVTLPTFYPEGVPKILIEAAATGRPIVTTNRPGCRDIVRDGENGLLVPQKDSEKLAEAILTLLNDPDLMEKYGKAGRKIVEEEFSEKIVVEKTLGVYEDLLREPQRAQRTRSEK